MPVEAGPSDPPSTSDIVHATNLSTCVLVVLVLSWILGGHQLAHRCRYLTEGSAACALGLLTGIILLIGHRLLRWSIVTQLLEFNAAGFFTYLLPPVIYYAGLSVEKSRFFTALPSILLYGVFGTLASFIIISVFMYLTPGFAMFKMEDCLAMGAIFSATDSVATLQVLDRDALPSLFALVFGEGVVNDAVSVVLLGAVAAASAHGSDSSRHRLAGGIVATFFWLLITSLLLGAAAGFGIAATLKKLRLDGAHLELAVITLLSYLSYLLADVSGLSAILALFVCGVVVSHYAMHDVTPEGRHATMAGFKTASYLSEGIIFIYVGMDALDPLKWQGANAFEALWLVLVLTVLLVVARAVFVLPCSLLHNCWAAPADRLGRRDVVIVWWAGLMRGAVSVALVYFYFDDNPRQMLDKGRATLIVSTLMVVMLSILGFGACTKPLLAAMLKGEAEAADLAAHLTKIPGLGKLAHTASGSSLFGDSPKSGGPSRPGHSCSRGDTPGFTTPPPTGDAWQGSTSSSSSGGNKYSSSGSRTAGGAAGGAAQHPQGSGPGWGLGQLGQLLMQGGKGRGAGSMTGAIGLQQFFGGGGAAAAAGNSSDGFQQQRQQAPAGGPVFALGGDDPAEPTVRQR